MTGIELAPIAYVKRIENDLRPQIAFNPYSVRLADVRRIQEDLGIHMDCIVTFSGVIMMGSLVEICRWSRVLGLHPWLALRSSGSSIRLAGISSSQFRLLKLGSASGSRPPCSSSYLQALLSPVDTFSACQDFCSSFWPAEWVEQVSLAYPEPQVPSLSPQVPLVFLAVC